MNPDRLRALLEEVQAGRLPVDQAIDRLRHLPFEAAGDAMIDHHRHLRCGFPEVIYAPGKNDDQIVEIAGRILREDQTLLITRVEPAAAERIVRRLPKLEWSERGRLLFRRAPGASPDAGVVGVVAAGTSDIPVAEEAAVTASLFGHRVDRLEDVGVAGLHRLLAHLDRLRACDALVVVAGMEGALPSVVGGLVDAPVVAVPTSVGYGASFSGLAALLAMLNSCASGITVVNIDNGFGGGYAAGLMARRRPRPGGPP